MLEEIVRYLTNARRLMLAVAGAGFALIVLLVLLYILMGAGAGPFAVGVVANLTLLIGAVGPQTLVAVAIVLAAAAWLTRRG